MDREVIEPVLRIVGEIAKANSAKEIDRLRDQALKIISESKKKEAKPVAG